jgi:hypothetical protein
MKMNQLLNTAVITLSVLGFGSIAMASGHHSKLRGVYTAELDQLNIDSQLPMSSSIYGGAITVDYDQDQAVLTLYPRFNCPADAYCAQMMPAPVVIELPIVSVYKDDCGSRVIVAEQNLVPVDGFFEQLEIHDNRSMTCKTLVAVPGTEVSYMSEGGRRYMKTFSTFSGPRLRKVRTASEQ